MSHIFFSLPLIAVVSLNAQSAVVAFQSPPEQTALLELYTSEGCSSCPPAESWLSRLKTSPGLWRDFVPVAFHLDYWDNLGWRDSWAARAFTDRQRAYAKTWRSDNVYTPGLVLNGREWRDWPGQKEGPKRSGAKAGVLRVGSSDGKRWEAGFAPANFDGANYEVHAALLAGDLSSDVKGGENRGRHLNHDFVVLSLVRASLTRAGDQARGAFVLPAQTGTAAGSRALAVWITRPGGLEPLQATGGWLVPTPPGH
jgi:hypothetical protein